MYKLMCEKHPEIQELWKPKVGDRVYSQHLKTTYTIVEFDKKIGWLLGKQMLVIGISVSLREDACVWLPRIEDLVGMVDCNSTYTLSDKFYEWLENVKRPQNWNKYKETGKEPIDKTMPELWLAFVSHELWGLKWDGERWE